MEVLHTHTLPDSRKLLLVVASSSGGGAWSRPVRMAVVLLEAGAVYEHARCRGVIDTLDVAYPDGRYRGPRSRYYAVRERLLGVLADAAQNYRPEAYPARPAPKRRHPARGAAVPDGALVITAEDLARAARAAGGAA